MASFFPFPLNLSYDWFVVDFLEFSAGVVTEDDFEIPSLCQACHVMPCETVLSVSVSVSVPVSHVCAVCVSASVSSSVSVSVPHCLFCLRPCLCFWLCFCLLVCLVALYVWNVSPLHG